MEPVARRVLAAFLFACVLFSALPLALMRLPFSDWEPLRLQLEQLPDRFAPDYPRFLEDVRRLTPPGAPIAIVARIPDPNYRFTYPYFRAKYLMPDREILPLFDPDGRPLAKYLDRSRALAAWGMDFPDPRFRTVWTGRGGVLKERVP